MKIIPLSYVGTFDKSTSNLNKSHMTRDSVGSATWEISVQLFERINKLEASV